MQKPDFSFFKKLYRRIGIDFGSSRLRVCTDQDGVVFDQPSCIAIEDSNDRVIAIGDEALEIQGRMQQRLTVHWPIKKGVIYDQKIAQALLRRTITPLLRTALLYGPEIMVSVPGSASPAQRQATTELMYSLGAREVYTIAQPLAASIGAGVPIADPSGSFILQLGEGVVETAVVSLGSMVSCQRAMYAGDFLKQHMQFVVANELELQLSSSVIEKLLHTTASLQPDSRTDALVTGKEAGTHSPREIHISSTVLHPAVVYIVDEVEAAIKHTLEDIPAELTVDIIDKGLLLTGGLARLHGLDMFLIQKLGMPVSVVDEPELAVIDGIKIALVHLDEFKQSLGYWDTAAV
ncbi:MAG: rod shape-determining protein [Patescibacteria group bacterium]